MKNCVSVLQQSIDSSLDRLANALDDLKGLEEYVEFDLVALRNLMESEDDPGPKAELNLSVFKPEMQSFGIERVTQELYYLAEEVADLNEYAEFINPIRKYTC